MREKEIAIIVVSYRSAGLTIDCLASIAAERMGTAGRLRIRCIVVDNDSGDTPAIAAAIEEHSWAGWVTLLTAERNGGFAYGNNLGIRHALSTGSPDHFHLLNPDTLLMPGAITALVDFLDAHEDAGIAGGIFENGDRSEWAIAFRFPSALGEFSQGLDFGLFSRCFPSASVPMAMGRDTREVDWISGASMMVKRSVIEAIGGLDEGFFLYFEETEFCFRAKRAGFGVWYVPASRVVHIAGQSTKVTERDVAPRRLPAYWYASRRRYFAVTRGEAYAVCADVLALVGHGLGAVKHALQHRPLTSVPYFMRDLFVQGLPWSRRGRGGRRHETVSGV